MRFGGSFLCDDDGDDSLIMWISAVSWQLFWWSRIIEVQDWDFYSNSEKSWTRSSKTFTFLYGLLLLVAVVVIILTMHSNLIIQVSTTMMIRLINTNWSLINKLLITWFEYTRVEAQCLASQRCADVIKIKCRPPLH